MKVLLINGSPHRSGNTFIALNEVAKTLMEEGLEAEIVHIGNKAVRGCIACGKCKQPVKVETESGETVERLPGRCVFDDDVANRISEKFAEADAFVFGSPVYYGQPNGALLSIMQRTFFSNGANVVGKPAASVAVCRRGGATAAFECMNMPMQMMNMPLATSQYWNIAYGREPGQAAMDVEGMQTMRTLARNLAWMVKGLRGENAPASPKQEPWAPMHFIR